MRRHHVVCLAFVVSAGAFASAQTWPAIPPIPLQERFQARSDLAVTLKLNASQLMAGEQPTFTLTLLNSGSSTLRVPLSASTDANVALRLFDGSGNELVATYSCIIDRHTLLSSVSSYLRLPPRQAHAFSLDAPCHLPRSLRPGDYEFEATYSNAADLQGGYDVYESGASAVWEGRVTTARVAFKVLPLDRETEQSLIALLDSAASNDRVSDAIRRLRLGGSAASTPALVRRFERDPGRRGEIAPALERSTDPSARASLAQAVERLSPDQRTVFGRLRNSGALLLDEPVIRPETPQPEANTFQDEIRPDPASVEAYVRDLLDGGTNEQRWQLAFQGVARFGTVEDFVRIKTAFVSGDEIKRDQLKEALEAMAFVSDRDSGRTRETAYWDAWWKNHAGQTRVQWAREALVREPLRSKLVKHDMAPSGAAEFLLASQGLSPALVRELAQHHSWFVRLVVAGDVAKADERSGGRLFIRELSNRYVGACASANHRLELLVRRRYQFDCADPSQRQQAIAHWTKVVNGLEPGFLPLTVASSTP